MKNLELYYFESCPYCVKVLRFLDTKGISITLKNIHKDKEAYNNLKEVGGKVQVPCLFIEGKPMYESNDIIAWLDENIS